MLLECSSATRPVFFCVSCAAAPSLAPFVLLFLWFRRTEERHHRSLSTPLVFRLLLFHLTLLPCRLLHASLAGAVVEV